MLRTLLRHVAPVLLLFCLVSVAPAQTPPEAETPTASTSSGGGSSGKNAVPSMALAFVSTVLVLFIVCKPARKI